MTDDTENLSPVERLLKAGFLSADAKKKDRNRNYESAIALHNQILDLLSGLDFLSNFEDQENSQELQGGTHNLMGAAYHGKGEYDLAIQNFDKAIELTPDEANYYYNRGNAYHEKGEYDHVIQDFEKAIQLNPKKREYRKNLAIVRVEKKAQEKAMKKRNKVSRKFEKAGDASKSTSEECLDQVKHLIEKATIERSVKENCDSVIKLCNQALEIVSDLDSAPNVEDQKNPLYIEAEIHNLIGSALNGKGEYARALQEYNKAIALNDRQADYYSNRGNLYNNRGEYDCAMQDFDKAIELNPRNAIFYSNRGALYNNLGVYDWGIKNFDKAIELDPEDADSYSNRGNAYCSIGEYDRALQDHNTAISLDSENAGFYSNRGAMYGLKGEYDQAINDFKKAKQLDPKEKQFRHNLSLARARKRERVKLMKKIKRLGRGIGWD